MTNQTFFAPTAVRHVKFFLCNQERQLYCDFVTRVSQCTVLIAHLCFYLIFILLLFILKTGVSKKQTAVLLFS